MIVRYAANGARVERAMNDDDLKYLDILQSVISRLAGNSFQLKSWSVALASVIIGLTAKDAHPELAWLAIIPTAMFWALDAYYLSAEREFRGLYNRYLDGTPPVPAPYTMQISLSPRTWGAAFVSFSVSLLHATIIIIAIVVCALAPVIRATAKAALT